MLNAIDKYEYIDEFDFDVYFTVLCNRLLERVTNGEPLEKELLISGKYNSAKNLKSLNKKQFIYNWKMDLLYNTRELEKTIRGNMNNINIYVKKNGKIYL